jgi:DNA-binding beta-propeller fold protein YncE
MTTTRRLAFLLLLAACSDSSDQITAPVFATGDTAFCVTLGADYKNNVGAMAAVALPSRTVTKDILHGAVSGDPVLRAAGTKLYVINRSVGNVTIVDTSSSSDWSVEAQFSTGSTSNPQDVAVAGNKLYVATYAGPGVEVWDLTTKTQSKVIDLSADDPDGSPNAQSVAVSGTHAYVTLDLLDTATPPSPRGPGEIAVVDTATDAVTDTLDLNFSNPYGFFAARGSTLIVPTLADFSGVDGCVEQIATGSSSDVMPCLVKNSDLGGTVSAIAVGASGTYLAVSTFDASFNQTASLRQLDAQGHLAEQPMTPSAELPTDVALAPNGQLVYADQKGGGIRVYDLASQAETTATPLDIGLPPASQNGIVCMSR